jgi:hypothetical protein
MVSVKDRLEDLDYINDLSALKFIDSYNSDPLVTEYINNLLEYPQCCPIVPSEEKILEYLDFPSTLVPPNELYVLLTTNFFSYFQVSYFKNNVQNATANGKTMFNPKCDFFMPQFPLVPEKVLNDMTRAKTAFVYHIQGYAVDGASFTRELLLLRNIKAIKDFVLSAEPGTLDTASHVKHIFSKGYVRAQLEFSNKYNVKNIDWNKREDKVRHTVPFWRKATIPVPPTTAYNKYAVSLSEDIRAGKISFRSEELKTEYRDFFSAPDAIISQMKSAVRNRATGRVGNLAATSVSRPYSRSRPPSSTSNGLEFIHVPGISAQRTLGQTRVNFRPFARRGRGSQRGNSNPVFRNHKTNSRLPSGHFIDSNLNPSSTPVSIGNNASHIRNLIN